MPDDNIDDTNWKYLRYYYQFQILACITTVTDDSNNILLYRCTNAGSRHLELCCPTKLTKKISMADNTTGLCRLMTASHPIHHHLTTPDNLDSDVIVLFCNNSGDPLVIPTINSQQAQWRSSQHCSTITIIISECPYPSASSMTNNKCTFPYPAAISNITFDTTTQCERLSHHTTHVKTRTMHWKNQTTSWFSRHDLKNRAHANTNHRSFFPPPQPEILESFWLLQSNIILDSITHRRSVPFPNMFKSHIQLSISDTNLDTSSRWYPFIFQNNAWKQKHF